MGTIVRILLLTLIASMSFGTLCFADDDDDNTPPLPKIYNLNEDKPKPKPKVIIKERIVERIVCPDGSTWNANVKKCQDEDGNDVVIAPKRKAQAKPRVADDEDAPSAKQTTGATNVPDYSYVFPRTKLRMKMGQCIMKDEAMTCDITFINTAEGTKSIKAKNVSIIDNFGKKFKTTSINNSKCYYGPDRDCNDGRVDYGTPVQYWYNFTYLDTRATSVTLSTIMWSDNNSDLIKIENFPITK